MTAQHRAQFLSRLTRTSPRQAEIDLAREVAGLPYLEATVRDHCGHPHDDLTRLGGAAAILSDACFRIQKLRERVATDLCLAEAGHRFTFIEENDL